MLRSILLHPSSSSSFSSFSISYAPSLSLAKFHPVSLPGAPRKNTWMLACRFGTSIASRINNERLTPRQSQAPKLLHLWESRESWRPSRMRNLVGWAQSHAMPMRWKARVRARILPDHFIPWESRAFVNWRDRRWLARGSHSYENWIVSGKLIIMFYCRLVHIGDLMAWYVLEKLTNDVWDQVRLLWPLNFTVW